MANLAIGANRRSARRNVAGRGCGFVSGSTGPFGRLELVRFLAEHRRRYNRKDPPNLTRSRFSPRPTPFTGRPLAHPVFGEHSSVSGTQLGHHRSRFAIRSLRPAWRLLLGPPPGRQQGVINRLDQPRLSEEGIHAWTDRHQRRTGSWPRPESGPIAGVRETWWKVDVALRRGARGLAGGSSLPRLLALRRAVGTSETCLGSPGSSSSRGPTPFMNAEGPGRTAGLVRFPRLLAKPGLPCRLGQRA